MHPKIAIPLPTSLDAEYNARSFPLYLQAIEAAGGQPIPVPLDANPAATARLLADSQGVLLPGCRYDIDPQIYGETRAPECNDPDPARAAVDELLLQDAFNLRKPILGICAGMQSLNVWRNGSLIQDLPSAGFRAVNHSPGRFVQDAHFVDISADSRLAAVRGEGGRRVAVNSSHHQAVRAVGDNLRVTAVSPEDGVVEAIELKAPDHFALGVQWHPERTFQTDVFSRALFAALVEEAERWRPVPAREAGTAA